MMRTSSDCRATSRHSRPASTTLGMTLPLPGISTAFVAKTGPFLAVLSFIQPGSGILPRDEPPYIDTDIGR